MHDMANCYLAPQIYLIREAPNPAAWAPSVLNEEFAVPITILHFVITHKIIKLILWFKITIVVVHELNKLTGAI